MYTIGVDVGGTYTDLVATDESGRAVFAKSPSTPADQSLGVMAGLEELARRLDLSRADMLARTQRLVHGTTVATNALLERKGAKVALLTTEGHRDVLEMREGLKGDRYDLRTPQEQLLFARLGVFAGSFALDAATKICSDLCHPERVTLSEVEGRRIDEIEILDLLASLTDKSLVVADTSGEHERYHLLESTRAYALEKLAAARALEKFARRHAEYFRHQAQAADDRRGTGSTAAWLAGMELELDNYRAVLEWALKDGHDFVLGGAVAGALSLLWSSGGLAVEARYWIGADSPDSETWTGALSWVDGKEKTLPLADVPPVAFSEGMRMASAIYAARVVEKKEDAS